MTFQQAQLGTVTPLKSNDALTALLFKQLQEKNQNKGVLGLGGGPKIDPEALSQLGDLLGELGTQTESNPIKEQPIGPDAEEVTLNPVQGTGTSGASALTTAEDAKKKKNGVFAEGSEILGGAATGAKLGSFGGPVGTGIGAIIGGLLGLFG